MHASPYSQPSLWTARPSDPWAVHKAEGGYQHGCQGAVLPRLSVAPCEQAPVGGGFLSTVHANHRTGATNREHIAARGHRCTRTTCRPGAAAGQPLREDRRSRGRFHTLRRAAARRKDGRLTSAPDSQNRVDIHTQTRSKVRKSTLRRVHGKTRSRGPPFRLQAEPA